MPTWAVVLQRLDIIVALLAIAAAMKSVYNGRVGMLIRNIQQIPQIADRVDTIGEKQEDMVDGMVALSIAEGEETKTIDTDRLAADLRDGQSYRDYINETRSEAYGPVEEGDTSDEERRWREGYSPDDF